LRILDSHRAEATMGAFSSRPNSFAAVLAGLLPSRRISTVMECMYSRFNLVPDLVSEPRSR
jgi:hypothetical protein